MSVARASGTIRTRRARGSLPACAIGVWLSVCTLAFETTLAAERVPDAAGMHPDTQPDTPADTLRVSASAGDPHLFWQQRGVALWDHDRPRAITALERSLEAAVAARKPVREVERLCVLLASAYRGTGEERQLRRLKARVERLSGTSRLDPSLWVWSDRAMTIPGRPEDLRDSLIAGVRAVEAGDTIGARSFLERAVRLPLPFDLAALVGTTRGGLALETGDGRAAWVEYARVDSLARRESRELAEWTPEHLLAWWNERPAEFAAWRWNPSEEEAGQALREAALDLHRPWSERPRGFASEADSRPRLDLPEATRRGVPEPTREEWHQLWSLVDSAATLGGIRRRLLEERDELLATRERDRVFYLRAREELQSEALRLHRQEAAIDSLERQARATIAALDRSRTATLARWGTAISGIQRRAALHQAVLGGMELRLIEEPEWPGARNEIGFASDRESLGVSYRGAELDAARGIESQVEGAERRLRDELMELSRRGWRPGLFELIERLRGEVDRQQEAVATDLDALDLRLARDPNRPALLALEARLRSLERETENLQAAYSRERRATAEAALARARGRIAEWRARLDYGLAAALHERLRSGQVSEAEDSELAAHAADRLRRFLTDHPDSPARADVRFRLADVELFAGRANPAAYDPTGPLDLLRLIWDEDPSFPHRDVVLFEIGVLETELGVVGGGATLERFLSLYPHSEHAQEAEVRLGDLAFDEREFGRATSHYARATRGGTAALAGIAWYKLGWSHFNQDEFAAAAADFSRLIDLYRTGALVGARFDLESESQEYLVHALARAGGAAAYRAHFTAIGSRDYEEPTLRGVNALLREHSLWNAAIDGTQLYLQRFPLSSGALEQARLLVDSYEQANRSAEAHSARLELAARFAVGSEWSRAAGDSLAADGDAFALSLTEAAAERAHARARETRVQDEWAEAYRIYQELLRRWPESDRVARWEMGSGEAAARGARYELAATHFARAASHAQSEPGASSHGDAALEVEAAFQEIAALDAAFEAEAAEGRPRFGARFLERSSAFRTMHGEDPRLPDLSWREGEVARQIGDSARAEAVLLEFARRHEADPRAPEALLICAEGSARRGDLPHAASLWGRLARQWPSRPDADAALYKSGALFAECDSASPALAAFERLLRIHPKSDLARDAELQIGGLREAQGDGVGAARAFRLFARTHPKDPEARASLAHAIDLLSEVDPAGADSARVAYLAAYPEDLQAQLRYREGAARAELARLARESTLRSVLASASGKVKSTRRPPSQLVDYLELARRHPNLADRALVAEVAFRQAEEERREFDRAVLSLPLESSLRVKKERLERAIAAYRGCVDQAILPWSRAAAFRLGEAIVSFGDALRESPRPSGLSPEDLAGYEAVLDEQAWTFHDRGEAIWADLLKSASSDDDPDGWVARTRQSLWPRVAARFLHLPEAKPPLLRPGEGRSD